MKSLAPVVLALAIGGCSPSLEEVRQEPLRFSETVPAPWDQVGACLAKVYAGEWPVSYIPTPSTRRAELIVSAPAMLLHPGSPLFVFEITGEQQTTVVFKRRTFAGGYERAEIQARERVSKCGAT
jgi:hypothetical protein